MSGDEALKPQNVAIARAELVFRPMISEGMCCKRLCKFVLDKVLSMFFAQYELKPLSFKRSFFITRLGCPTLLPQPIVPIVLTAASLLSIGNEIQPKPLQGPAPSPLAMQPGINGVLRCRAVGSAENQVDVHTQSIRAMAGEPTSFIVATID